MYNLLWLFNVFLLLLQVHGNLVVHSKLGVITGTQCNTSSVEVFYAIPYAKPPIGSLRFAPPQAWDEIYTSVGLNAQFPGVTCAQFGSSFLEPDRIYEDCLVLNIYRPANTNSSSVLPVKVWIYGGSNEAGGIFDPVYTGCFAAVDSIFVSINYRLGPLGFMALEAFGLKGNFGIQDQLLGLQWVHDNIAIFGGDPNRVLLFGQSAGAVDVFTLATLPQIKSLVSSAAMESGGGRDLPRIDNVQSYNTLFAHTVNCSSLECLQATTIQNLQQAVLTLSNNFVGADTLLENGGFGGVWGPVVDGDFVEIQPSQRGVQVPSIFGSNADDATLFVLGDYQTKILNLTENDYREFLQANFGQLADTIEQQFSVSLFNGTPLPVYSAIVAVVTDYAYKCPAYRALTIATKNGIDVWAYNFNHTPSCLAFPSFPTDPAILKLLGSTHTAELPFIFGEVDHLPLPSGNCSFTSSEKDISAFMLDAWTSLSANNNPSLDWPKWDGKMGINIQDTVTAGEIDYSVCEFWNQIADTILQSASTNSTPSANETSNSSTTLTSSALPAPTLHSNAASLQPALGVFLTILSLIGGMVLGL